MSTTETHISPIQAHMAATLVPDPATGAKLAGLVSPDQDNVAGYSILSISSPTNKNISMFWNGDEAVFDPGEVFATRSDAFRGCDKLEAEGAEATAFVVHWTSGDWAVFINPGRH